MEETATNIYLPSPLQGLIGPDFSQTNNSSPGNPNKLNSNVIWITGEFFGVQRARDMLFQVSLSKVCQNRSFPGLRLLKRVVEQTSTLSGHRDFTSQARLDGHRTLGGSKDSGT